MPLQPDCRTCKRSSMFDVDFSLDFLRDIKPAQQFLDNSLVTVLRIDHMLALAQARCDTVACSGV